CGTPHEQPRGQGLRDADRECLHGRRGHRRLRSDPPGPRLDVDLVSPITSSPYAPGACSRCFHLPRFDSPMHHRRRVLSVALLAATLAPALVLGSACKHKAIRGGPGTENPDFDEGAMSTGLDRKDLQGLMQDNMSSLVCASICAQWRAEPSPPVVAIWPIKNDTTEHLDDQMLTLLS